MGFADYLKRNPSQPPPPTSSDDTKFTTNTICTFKYILLNKTVEKMNAAKYQTRNDVIHKKARTAQKTNAFCQIRCNNQSPAWNSISHLNNPISKFSIQVNSIHSSSLNPSIYKSSNKSSIFKSDGKFHLSNHKSSSKIIPLHLKSNSQSLSVTQIIH